MKQLILFFVKKIRTNNVSAYAAQAALFLIMSTIPFLMVLLSLLKFTPVTEDLILTGIELISPDYVSGTVINIVDEVYHNSGGVLIISLVIAIYSAARAVQSLRNGLNIAYEVEESRNWFILRLRAMLETFGLIIAILLLMVLLMFGRTIQGVLLQYFPWIAVATEWVLNFRMLILFVILILILVVVYKALPNRKMKFRSQLLGAVLCTAAWYVLTYALSIYINYFNGFSLYGSLTSVVLILFWLYMAMFIFLACGTLNSSVEMIFIEVRLLVRMNRQERKNKREQKEQKQTNEIEDHDLNTGIANRDLGDKADNS
ncbi:MAG: YihY/virulence factor BrkB family protein [Lachnospiraceae bacterium]|nr:YihY/virulence factor BrkB family protein [Lachnospiraceae bacterium]